VNESSASGRLPQRTTCACAAHTNEAGFAKRAGVGNS
jgi:hypothetical protein